MARSSRRRKKRHRDTSMVFTRRNYVLLLLGIFIIAVGYTLMRMENEVEGFLSLYVSPLLILGGYLEIIYAILWRPAHSPQTEEKGEPA